MKPRTHIHGGDPVEGKLYLYAEHGSYHSSEPHEEPQDNLRAARILLPAAVIGAALALAAIAFFLK